jgi:L-ascorbate metabolism protein UlaG (beta-lactamase superfamily)
MKIRRLSWAGIEIQTKERRLLIEAMQTTAPLRALLGDPLWPPVAIGDGDGKTPVDALVTHRHSDHYDVGTLKRSLGPAGRIFCPAEILPELEAAGLNGRGVILWETVYPPASEGIAITAVPAVDWRGDYQVSWVVDDGEHRIFHGGDTIRHGSWWKIVERFRSFDVVFLPVNGVVARLVGLEPSNLPATLTPE